MPHAPSSRDEAVEHTPPSQDEATEADAAVQDDLRLAAAARDDPRAFAPLYARYVTPVYRYCYLRLGDRTVAEDATSEVFTKALANLGGYREGHFAAWLFRIARNVVSDAYRRSHPTEPLEVTGERPDGDPTPEEQTLERERSEALRAALARLPDAQRHAVELQLAGWSVAESAAALGVSPGALKVARFRALGRLRALLGGPDDRSGRRR